MKPGGLHREKVEVCFSDLADECYNNISNML